MPTATASTLTSTVPTSQSQPRSRHRSSRPPDPAPQLATESTESTSTAGTAAAASDSSANGFPKLILNISNRSQRPTADSVPPLLHPPDLLGFGSNDAGNANRFHSLHSSSLRYCPKLKSWYWWDGMRWTRDRSLRVKKLAIEAMTAYHDQARSNGNDELAAHANSSLSAASIRGMLDLAQSKFEHLVPEFLDQRPDLLNFTNGTLDLSTGTLSPHSPSDQITRLIHHAYVPASPCPRFIEFLYSIFDYDEDLVTYVQTALGYSLTGHTSARAVFVLFGTGRNGKTTLLTLFHQLIREYAVIIQVESLLSSKSDSNAQADLADLHGARFVQTSESEQGALLAASQLKRLTQGMGSIRVVRKYENPITVPATHKLWVDTNFRPVIQNADDQALFARLHPIRFPIQISAANEDPQLLSALLAESEGILAWAAAGALRWYEAHRTLSKPDAVQHEIREWHLKSDWMERFLCDRCFVSQSKGVAGIWSVEANTLYMAYQTWVEDGNDDHLHSMREFGARMQKWPGIKYKRHADKRRYWGVKLRVAGGRAGASKEEQDTDGGN